MAVRRFELDELTVRPGTYVNPQTEVVIVVDDSAEIDQSSFPADVEGAEWVLVSDETPIDEAARDELLEHFQSRHHEGGAPSATAEGDDPEDPDETLDEDDDVDELE